MRALIVVCAVAGVVTPSVADSQPEQRPARPYRGLFGEGPPADPNRTRRELSLTASALGGFDDYITMQSSGPVQAGQDRQSGYTGAGDATLAYWMGREARSFSAEARAFANAYTTIDVAPTVGVDTRLRFQSDLGRVSRLDVTQSVIYQPTLVLGAFAPLENDVDRAQLPDADQTSGLVEQRSWSATSAATLERRWTPRHTTNLGYNYAQQTYLEDFGYDSRMQVVNMLHTWTFTRNWSLRPTYRFSRIQLEDTTDAGTPVANNDLELGLGYVFRLSPTRQVQLLAGGGSTHVSTLSSIDRTPLQYWTPSGYGSVDADLGRSWSLSINYRRAATVLPGVTLQSFATDAAAVQAEGLLGPRIQLAFSAGLSNGHSGGGVQLGRFESYSGNVQLRYAVARCCAVLTNYDYYYYRLRGIPGVPNGVPREYDRNAVRIGMTFWLPLSGSRATQSESRAADGR